MMINAQKVEDEQILDMEAVAAARATMKEKFPMIVQFYLEDAADSLKQIDGALSDGQADKVVPPAHTLKSSSKQIGAVNVSEIARQLEEITRQRLDCNEPVGDDIAALFERLRDAFGAVEPKLKRILDEETA